MAASAHTPGPWHIGSKGGSVRAPIARTTARGDSMTVERIIAMLPATPERGADARLIAAAPELLEALRGLVGQRDLTPDRLASALHLWDDALAAIAKAEGR